MNCADIRRALAIYHDGQLEEGLRHDIEEHLATCAGCAAAYAALQELPAALKNISSQHIPTSLRRRLLQKTAADREGSAVVGATGAERLGRAALLTTIVIVVAAIGLTFLVFSFTLLFGSRFESVNVFDIKGLVSIKRPPDAGLQAERETASLVLKADGDAPKALAYLPRPTVVATGNRYGKDSLEQVAVQPIVMEFAQEYRGVEARLYRDAILSGIAGQAGSLSLDTGSLQRCVCAALAAAGDESLPSYVEKAVVDGEEVVLIVVNKADKKRARQLSNIAVFALEPARGTIVAAWPRGPLNHDVELDNINPHTSLSCVACHPNFEGSTGALKVSSWKAVARRTCTRCHSHKKQYAEYAASIHGRLALAGKPGENGHKAPVCGDCHDAHATLASSDKPQTLAEMRTHAKNICGDCHRDYWDSYNDYYHGKGYKAATPDAPACWDCHGYHDIQPSNHGDSRVSAANLPKTCIRCHEDADLRFVEYGKLVHGRSRELGSSPVWQRLNQGIGAIRELLK